MKDLYLQVLLQGEASNINKSAPDRLIKNPFEVEIEKQIDEHIKELSFENNPYNRFITPAMQIARVRAELREESKLSELSQYLDESFTILVMQGKNYLSEKQHNEILEEFANGLTYLDSASFTSTMAVDFKTLLSLSDATEANIVSMAEKKAAETGLASCLPLYVLLSLLAPGNATYWYRAAIACHSNKNYTLAIRFYNTAFTLEPELIGAKFFLSDCYLAENMPEEALQCFQEAKKLSEPIPLEGSWELLVSQLSQKLHA